MGTATVWHTTARKSVWGGAVICGNPWACPVCAARIQERRRAEIASAMSWVYASEIEQKDETGHTVKVSKKPMKAVMITLTFPHTAFDSVRDLLARQRVALRALRSGAAAKRLRQKIGHIGLIRALELTHGRLNGWHPHTHELWFVASKADAEMIKAQVLSQWRRACERAGLLDPEDKAQQAAFAERAVDVKDRVETSKYLAKIAERDPDNDEKKRAARWGADREVASATTKNGRRKGRSLPQLLAAAADGDKKAGALWLEAIDALRGRPWIYWSAGLKGLVGIEEKTDEEVAKAISEQAQAMAELDKRAWDIVRRTRSGRADVLTEVEKAIEAGGGPDEAAAAIERWITAALVKEWSDELAPKASFKEWIVARGGGGKVRAPWTVTEDGEVIPMHKPPRKAKKTKKTEQGDKP